MPLIQCPDCPAKVSDKATACPACGRPLKHDHAPLSSVFSFVAAVSLLAFIWGVTKTVSTFQHWSFRFILIWGVMLAIGLIIWAARELPKPFNKHLIGNPTLSMVGGVAGGVIAAVALAFTLNSALDQEKVVKQQLDVLKRIEAKLTQLQQTLPPRP